MIRTFEDFDRAVHIDFDEVEDLDADVIDELNRAYQDSLMNALDLEERVRIMTHLAGMYMAVANLLSMRLDGEHPHKKACKCHCHEEENKDYQ